MTQPIKYANLSTGLRGCYADSNGGIVSFKTRKQLKKLVEYEVSTMTDAGYIGASKRKIAGFVQEYWTRIHSSNPGYLDTVLPLKPHHAGNYSWGLFLSPSSRQDYVSYCNEDN